MDTELETQRGYSVTRVIKAVSAPCLISIKKIRKNGKKEDKVQLQHYTTFVKIYLLSCGNKLHLIYKSFGHEFT